MQIVGAPAVVCDVIYQLIIVTCIVTLASKATAARKLINVYHVRMHYTAMVLNTVARLLATEIINC